MQRAIRPLHLALFIGLMVVWSFSFVVAKWGLEEVPPLLFVTLRFLVVAAVLLPFVPRPHGHWRQILGISFTLGFLHFALMFTGLLYVPASTVVLIIQLQVPFAALLAAVFLGDRLGWRRALGMVLSLLGVAVVLGVPDLEAPWWAELLVVASSFCWAFSTVQIKGLGQIHGGTLNAWIALFAVPQLFVGSLLLEEGQWAALQAISWRGVIAVVYQSLVVVVLGYGLWYRLLRLYDVNQTMPFTLLILPLSVLFAGLFLGEPLTWTLALGGAMTIVGVGIIVLRRPRLMASGAGRV